MVQGGSDVECVDWLDLLLHEQVFGLGNKTYEHFNAMGKYVDQRLEELGAKRIFELGIGDDDAKWVGFRRVCVCSGVQIKAYFEKSNTNREVILCVLQGR